MNFNEQSQYWLHQLLQRRRGPVKPGTVRLYTSYLNNWILPNLGAVDLQGFTNSGLKTFVQVLSGGLKPKTIVDVVSVVKQIVASAQDSEGVELYPRKWNDDFIDLPIVDRAQQKTPCATTAAIEKAIRLGDLNLAGLIIVLAGAGLRIGEARALRYGGDNNTSTRWDSENRLIHVQTAMDRSTEQSPKTKAGVRLIDLPERLNKFLGSYCRETQVPFGGFIFASAAGQVLSDSTLRDRLGKTAIDGFHSLRRFRVTRLREYGVPEDVIKYWIGHEGQGITDRYSKLGQAQYADVRKKWAEQVGLGFGLQKYGGEYGGEYGGDCRPAEQRAVRET